MKKIEINIAKWPGFDITTIPELKLAAKREIKTVVKHFTTKGQGWDLRYQFLVEEIFYSAYGHHLENYLLAEIKKMKVPVQLKTGKHGGLVVSKLKGADLRKYMKSLKKSKRGMSKKRRVK